MRFALNAFCCVLLCFMARTGNCRVYMKLDKNYLLLLNIWTICFVTALIELLLFSTHLSFANIFYIFL